jgi:hypothetical protein
MAVVSTDQRNTLSKTHIVEYMSKIQRDRRSPVRVKNAELWERWQRGPNESLNRLSRLSFPRRPTGQGIGKLASLTTACELNERQKRPWNLKPWQSDLPQVLHRPIEMAVESGHSGVAVEMPVLMGHSGHAILESP